MFRNIAVNLEDGIGTTPHPTQDPRAQVEAALAVRPLPYFNVIVTATGNLNDGIGTHFVSVVNSEMVEYDSFTLRKETAAREGGLHGALTRTALLPSSSLSSDLDRTHQPPRLFFLAPVRYSRLTMRFLNAFLLQDPDASKKSRLGSLLLFCASAFHVTLEIF